MGSRGLERLVKVDLPLAVPVIASGLRVAAVSNVSIVSVASLVGFPRLGYYLTDGYQRTFSTEIAVFCSSAAAPSRVYFETARRSQLAMLMMGTLRRR